MKIIQRYVYREAIRSILLSAIACTSLFLAFDFLDRIDNILQEDTTLGLVFTYFAFKVPILFNLTLPLAMLVGTMLSFGILSKNTEITAMRAAGLKISWFARPLFYIAFSASILSLVLNETCIPYLTRRVREIYNIEIKAKHKTGNYNQTNFWWRDQENFYASGLFDSQRESLIDFSHFVVNPNFEVLERINAESVDWIGEPYGWRMQKIKEYQFSLQSTDAKITEQPSIPLLLAEEPKDFYDKETDTFTMSFAQLYDFIKKQGANGIPTVQYYADLHAKLASPFVSLMICLVALPFALISSRSGNLAKSFFLGLIASFSYYAVHSFSLSLGRAELWHPLFAAWVANLLLGFIGCLLLLGAESPE
jgi:lipopolysaccharide export system permease protein